MSGLHFDITADNTNLMQKLQETERGIKNTSKAIEREGGSIEALFSRMTKAATAFGAGFTAKELVNQVIKVRGEFQQLEVAFTTMLGSQEKAFALMMQLTETAAKTPFDLQGVANGARQLLAYGTAAEDVNDTLVRLGNIAAGLSIPLNDLVYLYGTTMTQGRLYTQDLNQFTGRGIPMIKELAKEFGVAESEIKAMVEAGQVGFPEVQKVINNLTNEGGMFFNLMQEQSKTITGQISNISDSFSMILNDIGKANEGIINDALGGVSYLIENYETVGRTLLEIVGTYGAYKAALITITSLQKAYTAILAQSALNQSLAAASGVTLSNSQALAATRTKLLQMAQAALNKTLLANPYVAAAAAVAALGLGIYKLITYQTEAEKAQERLNNAVKESEESSLSEQRELAKLRGELSALKEGTDEYNAVKEKIINGYSKYYDGLEEEINQVGLTEQAYDKLTKAINRSFGARQYQQFKSQQESELDSVMADNLGKIQDRLIDKLGEEAGSKYYVKIRDAIMQGSLKAINGTFNIKGLDKETMSALDKVAGFDGGLFDITNRAIEGYIANILNAMTLTDELDRKAKQRFGILDEISQHPGQYEETFSAESESISNLEKELDKAQEKLASLKKSLAAGNITQEAISQQEAYVKSLQDTILVRERDLKIISEVEAQISKLKKEQKETVYGSSEYNSLQSRINTLESRLPQTKSDKNIGNEQKLSDELLKLQEENEDRQVDLIKEGTEKQLAEINLRYDREIEAVKKLRAELEQAQGGKLTTEQVSAFDSAVAGIEAGRKRDTGNVWNEKINRQEQAWNRYLQEYGTFQQKRQAITEEYDRKIAEAQNAGEAAILQKQMEKALSSLNMDKLKQEINWELVFSDLGNASKESLEKVKKQLKDFKDSNEYKEMSVEQIQVVDEALNKIQDAIIDKGGLLGDLPDQLEELRVAQEELTKAQEEYNQALKGGTEKQKESAQKKLNEAQKKLANQQGNVNKATDKAIGNFQLLSGTLTELGEASEMSLSQLGNLVQGIAGAFGESGSKIGGIIGSVFSLLDSIGSQGLDGFVGNIFKSVGNAAYGAWDTIFGWTGIDFGGDSDPHLEEDLQRLAQSNQDLEAALDNLSEKMDSSSVAEAMGIYSQQVDNINKQMRNTQEAMLRSHAAYSDGFLGIGGDHSSGHEINQGMTAAEWQEVSKVVGKTVNDAEDFFNLTSEEMWRVANEATSVYSKIKDLADNGYRDAAQYMDEYISYWQELEELQDQYREKLTSTSFDAIKNDFRSALLDMEDSTEDFAKNFEKMMQQAMLESFMTEKYDEQLKSWYKYFSQAMEDGALSNMESLFLESWWGNITNDATREWEALRESMGWDTGTSSQQSATAGYSTTASQDSIDQMYGRFTAMYEVDLRMYESLQSLLSLTVSAEQRNTILSEIRNLAISSNGYLEDIAGFQKKIWYIVNKNLDDINGKLNKL